MAERTLSRVCRTYDEAVQFVYQLEQAGVPDSAVNVIGSDADPRAPTTLLDDRGTTATGLGATIGTVLGGGVGVLAGIGALTVPGLAPLVAAGWLVAGLAGAGVGAAAGALLGFLVELAVGRRQAVAVNRALENGQYVVLARVDDALVPSAQEALRRLPPGAGNPPAAPEPLDPMPRTAR